MMGYPHIGAHVDTIEDPLSPLTQISDQPVDVRNLIDFKPSGPLVPLHAVKRDRFASGPLGNAKIAFQRKSPACARGLNRSASRFHID
jgi:hypothetical protein